MRIVIFAGGTGSIALQRGLYDMLDANLDGVDTKIIVNAYDNGRSTGDVRRVMYGQTLGPSDVRKNQLISLQLRDPKSPWARFLSIRFTASSLDAEDSCNNSIERLLQDLSAHGRPRECRTMLFGAVHKYFQSPLSGKILYRNFCLANILYTGLAAANGNSLRTAARIMAEAMGIPDNVLLNDDRSLFLGAVTRSGQRIPDEGEIVSWGNESDPFVDVFFSDAEGTPASPTLCPEAAGAVLQADLIILSSGTQWSSLIPTYASTGFRKAIGDSTAKIIMIMNRTPDHDSPGQSASDLIEILVPRHFAVGQLNVLADANSHPKMRGLSASAASLIGSFTQTDLSQSDGSPDRHDPAKLAAAIGHVFFSEYLSSDFHMFDYDDTLVGRENSYPKSSAFNISGIVRLNSLTAIGICTGNTITSLNLRPARPPRSEGIPRTDKPLLVFADGGVNEYSYDWRAADAPLLGARKCICPDAQLPADGQYCSKSIIAGLKRAGVPSWKIDDRANSLIAIRPVDAEERDSVVLLARQLIQGSNLRVRESGRTTVEICNPALSKAWALKRLRSLSASTLRITYVGDELAAGNDREIWQLAEGGADGLVCLHVDSPAKTAFYIQALTSFLCKHDNC